MQKVIWKPGNMLYPVPAVMVSCGDTPEDYNIITVSWTGTICTAPPMCYISVRPERHSHAIIKRSMCFVINLPSEKLLRITDLNGVKSGRDMDKFSENHLTPVPAREINAPLIGEAPVNIECRVVEIKPLGSHDMFIAEIVAVNVDENLIDPKTQTLHLDKAKLFAYSHGFYYLLGKKMGRFGFSVKKSKK
jgi:flavin reductase (DIM6/NTAB) family NADH-FMN oxidoreductase RutF